MNVIFVTNKEYRLFFLTNTLIIKRNPFNGNMKELRPQVDKFSIINPKMVKPVCTKANTTKAII